MTGSNLSFGRAVVAWLRASGVRRVFMSPGARSTPIVAALAESGMECVIHYDERGMSFAALGCAMATGEPSVCLTTSGSAVANLLPACVEASQSHVPLVFLTADRPAELRGTGANQTILQPGILGSYARFEVDIPCPGEGKGNPLLALREAFDAASGARPGPVHVNLQFREPLLGGDSSSLPAPSWRRAESKHPTPRLPDGWNAFRASRRGVVVIGRLDAAGQQVVGDAVALGKQLGWPVIADALSGARKIDGAVRHADWLLHRKDVPKPERVLHFGGSLVSKRLGEWISASCASGDWLQVRAVGERWDPWGKSPEVLCAGVAGFCKAADEAGFDSPHDDSWSAAWLRADAAVEHLLTQECEVSGELSEPAIARVVGRRAGIVYLGNSMPVRDFDSCDFAMGQGERLVFCNRGASGIDGNIATVAGVARGCGSPVVALLGDLAVLHDLNSLALLRSLPVTLVVVNNDGGGIFRFLSLPVPDADREMFWETPHGMDFKHAAGQFGIEYAAIGDLAELDAMLLASGGGPRLLECRTNRRDNHAMHDSIAAKVAALTLGWC